MATEVAFIFSPRAIFVTVDRYDLRRRLRAGRQIMPSAERLGAALSVARRVTDWPIYGAAIRIGGYWACNGELDPMPLLESAWAASKDVYLPVLVGAPPQSLRFAPYRPGLPLRRNRFDIPEPDVPPSEWLQPESLDLVLTPVVAFDSTGTRLGMGGGFYDRSFAFLRDPDYRGQRSLLLGLGYEFQKTREHLVRQSWDVPLDAAATEEALYVFSRANAEKWR